MRLLSLFAKIKNKRNQLVRARSRVSRLNSMRDGEGRNSWSLLAITTKPRAVVGRGEKSLVSGPRSGLPLGRGKEKEKCENTTVGGASKEEKEKRSRCVELLSENTSMALFELANYGTWTTTLYKFSVFRTLRM